MQTAEIKPGIYENIPFSEYLAWPCFHKSMVAPILRSGAHLKHYIESDQKTSKFMDFGSLVDCMLLEPDIFGTEFAEIPETYTDAKGVEKPWNLRSNTCRDWVESQKAQNVTTYSKADYTRALEIIENIQGHETASNWITGGKQVAIVWRDEETGILCKSRLDILRQDRIVDLKITGNASLNEFKRTFNNFGYHIQAAVYSEGWAALNSGESLPFGIVVAESEAPHCVATYEPGPESMSTGLSIYRRAIGRYKDYLENGATGYSKFPEVIEIPGWAASMEADNDE